MMTIRKTMKMLLALAAALAFASVAEAKNSTPITVKAGEHASVYESYNIYGPSNNNNEVLLNVHGSATVCNNSTLNFDNGSKTFYILLGSNPGDQGVFVMSNATYRAGQKGNILIGYAGGGDQAKLKLYDAKPGSVTQIFRTLTLHENADTGADSFPIVEISSNALLSVQRGIYNNNAKPLEIGFTSYDVQSHYPCLDKQMTTSFTGLFNPEAGDIVLRTYDVGIEGHSTNTIIKLSMTGNSGNTVYFFPEDPSSLNGVVRTEGPGSVWIDLSNYNNNNNSPVEFVLNAAKFVWNHTGDFMIGRNDDTKTYNTLKVTADNALPYGQQTGRVILRSKGTTGVTQSGYTYPTLDLAGTTQRINGYSITGGGGVVTNSAETEAVLVFGTGNTDGVAYYLDITNSAIRCEKTGTGTLNVGLSAFNTLSGDGGTIYVEAETYVDTLALTNVNVTYKNNDSSLLTVRENRSVLSSISLPDGVATNCVLKFPDFGMYSGSTVTKDGPGFVTYMTPDDANGAGLSVNAGVLRFGGEECTNRLWRLSLKKANNNGKTYEFPNGSNIFVNVGIGAINFFTSEGLGALNTVADTSDGSTPQWDTEEELGAAGDSVRGAIITKNRPFQWNSQKAAAWGAPGGSAGPSDPIFRGGTSRADVKYVFGGPNATNNTYDVACTNKTMFTDAGIINYSSESTVFTNAVLDPENSSTWEVVTWVVRKVNKEIQAHTSYSLWRPVNWSGAYDPYVTDWSLESSNDGINWTLMDERTNQKWSSEEECGLSPYYCFTYNKHIPYLFKSRNANWRFTTFGKVSVAAGAKLDLSELPEENIAFNALAVDCTAGAGTITHFAPVENGALYLENVPADQAATFQLPITIENWIDPAKMQTWSVYVNGELVEKARIDIYDGGARVRRYKGIVLMIQ